MSNSVPVQRISPAANRLLNFFESLAEAGETVCAYFVAVDKPAFGLSIMPSKAPCGFSYTVPDARDRIGLLLGEYLSIEKIYVTSTVAQIHDLHPDGMVVKGTRHYRGFTYRAGERPEEDHVLQWTKELTKDRFEYTLDTGLPRQKYSNEEFIGGVPKWKEDLEDGMVSTPPIR